MIAAPDVLEHLPFLGYAIELRQAGDRVDLFVERNCAEVVGVLRRDDQRLALLAFLKTAPAIRPEAVLAIVAETAERLAQVGAGGARREEIALGAGQEIGRGQVIQESRQRRTFLHGLVDVLTEDVQLGAIEAGKVVDRIAAPGIEQMIENAIRHLRRLYDPPVRLLEHVAVDRRMHQFDRTRLIALLIAVLLIDALHGHGPIGPDVLHEVEPDRIVAALQAGRILKTAAIDAVEIGHHLVVGGRADERLEDVAAACLDRERKLVLICCDDRPADRKQLIKGIERHSSPSPIFSKLRLV